MPENQPEQQDEGLALRHLVETARKSAGQESKTLPTSLLEAESTYLRLRIEQAAASSKAQQDRLTVEVAKALAILRREATAANVLSPY